MGVETLEMEVGEDHSSRLRGSIGRGAVPIYILFSHKASSRCSSVSWTGSDVYPSPNLPFMSASVMWRELRCGEEGSRKLATFWEEGWKTCSLFYFDAEFEVGGGKVRVKPR